MKPTAEEDARFIETDLLPEMVHDRCFCEAGSREFVELAEVEIEPIEAPKHQLGCALYRVAAVVEFSGEPKTFRLLVKLLPEEAGLAYDGFLNEEIMWNKGTLQYGKSFLPRFYVADMGRYGRPVVVVEDLERNGYERVLDRELNGLEAKALVELVGRFHGRGLKLKEDKFSVYREFQAKFQEITLAGSAETESREMLLSLIDKLKSTPLDEEKRKEIERFFGNDFYTKCKDSLLRDDNKSITTICQGLLIRDNVWFKKNVDETVEAKILDWQRVRHGPNTLDLAMILAQSDADLWHELIDSYCEAVQKECSSASSEELRQGLLDPGFLYALLVLSIESERLPIQFPKIAPLLFA